MEDFFLVCVYTPNSQDGLKRLDYRMRWEDDFRAYLTGLSQRENAKGEKMGVIVCGDLNVAHKEIDLKNPKSNRMNAGWRIDYFVTSENLKDRLEGAKIHTEIYGSDHCPVELTLK